MTAQSEMNDLNHAQVCGQIDYTIRANWKIVFENNRECYHCRGGHPEFCLSNYDVGVNGDRRANAEYEQGKARIEAVWHQLGAPLHEVNFPNGLGYRIAGFAQVGFVTEASKAARRPADGPRLSPASAPAIITLPNSWIHVNCDYTVTTRLTRRSGDHAGTSELPGRSPGPTGRRLRSGASCCRLEGDVGTGLGIV
jgi:Rieske 2Fe-2S family protein